MPKKQVLAEVSPSRIGLGFVVVYFALYCGCTANQERRTTVTIGKPISRTRENPAIAITLEVDGNMDGQPETNSWSRPGFHWISRGSVQPIHRQA